jgi:hypothetical protein
MILLYYIILYVYMIEYCIGYIILLIYYIIFKKWEGAVGTGWSGLRIGTGGGHL